MAESATTNDAKQGTQRTRTADRPEQEQKEPPEVRKSELIHKSDQGPQENAVIITTTLKPAEQAPCDAKEAKDTSKDAKEQERIGRFIVTQMMEGVKAAHSEKSLVGTKGAEPASAKGALAKSVTSSDAERLGISPNGSTKSKAPVDIALVQIVVQKEEGGSEETKERAQMDVKEEVKGAPKEMTKSAGEHDQKFPPTKTSAQSPPNTGGAGNSKPSARLKHGEIASFDSDKDLEISADKITLKNSDSLKKSSKDENHVQEEDKRPGSTVHLEAAASEATKNPTNAQEAATNLEETKPKTIAEPRVAGKTKKTNAEVSKAAALFERRTFSTSNIERNKNDKEVERGLRSKQTYPRRFAQRMASTNNGIIADAIHAHRDEDSFRDEIEEEAAGEEFISRERPRRANHKKYLMDDQEEKYQEYAEQVLAENKYWESKFKKYYKKFAKLQQAYDGYLSSLQATQGEMMRVLVKMQKVKGRKAKREDEYLGDDRWLLLKRENGLMMAEIEQLHKELDKLKRGSKKNVSNNEYIYN